MPATSLLPAEVTATSFSATQLELGAVLVVVLLFVALLLVRAKQSRDQKIRKAASEGYFDLDVARYVHAPIPDPPTTAADDPDRPLAPTFVAPTRAKSSKRGAPAPPPPRPVATVFGSGAVPGTPPRPVPAFDQAAAMSLRPPTPVPSTPLASMPSLGPPPPPPPPMGVPAAPLPRMEQPVSQPGSTTPGP